MTALLELEIVGHGELDDAIWELRDARLERRDGRLLVACGDPHAARVLLARAGVRASESGGDPVSPPALMPAIVDDLGPRIAPGALDQLWIRALGPGEATLRSRRRALRLRPARTWYAAEPTRRLLRDEDRVFAWRRVIWASAALLRSGRLGRVRPVIFDREAVGRTDEHHERVRAGGIRRWTAAG